MGEKHKSKKEVKLAYQRTRANQFKLVVKGKRRGG